MPIELLIACQKVLRVQILLGAAAEAIVVAGRVHVAPLLIAALLEACNAHDILAGALVAPAAARVQAKLLDTRLGSVLQMVKGCAEFSCCAKQRRAAALALAKRVWSVC